MNNILKLATIALFAFVANNSQATELVKAQPVNTVDLVEVTKLHLAQAIKLNTVAFNPIEKTARAQVAMNSLTLNKSANTMRKEQALTAE
ncbi:MAG: hypothetical protein ACPG52_08575 [Cognaticolwellia sp.]